MQGGPDDELIALRKRFDLDYLREDIPALLRESSEGIHRVKKIVQDLKDFAWTGQEMGDQRPAPTRRC